MKIFNLRTALFTLFTLTATAFTFWLFLLFNYDPYTSGIDIFFVFYLTMFIYIGGIFSLLIYLFKINLTNKETIYQFFKPSVRQGYIISGVFMISLILKGLNIFGIFEFFIIVAIGLISELYFKTKYERYNSSNN